MLVHTPFRKSWEWEMSTRIRLNLSEEEQNRGNHIRHLENNIHIHDL